MTPDGREELPRHLHRRQPQRAERRARPAHPAGEPVHQRPRGPGDRAVPGRGADQGRGDAADLRRLAAADRPDRPRRTGHRICRKHRCPVARRSGDGPGPGLLGGGPGASLPAIGSARRDEWRNPRGARNAFLWPTLLVVLLLAIFPLVASLGLALSNLQFVQGGFKIKFIGLTNFSNLFFGADRTQFLGQFRPPTIIGWVFFVGGTALTAWAFVRYLRGRSVNPLGIVGRAAGAVALIALLWLVANTLLGRGRPAGNARRDVHLRHRRARACSI